MEKLPRSDYDDPNSLTTFNIITEGEGEGMISKFFQKFKTAVTGPQQPTSPSSSTRTISIVLSNESGMVVDQEEDPVTNVSATVPSPATVDTEKSAENTNTSTAAAVTKISTSASSATITPKNLREMTPTTAIITTTASTTTAATKAESKSSIKSNMTNKRIVFDEDINQKQEIDYPQHLLIPTKRTPSIDSDTQSIVTTFSVSNTNSLSRILNRLRGAESIDSNKDFWMPDEQCRECFDCNAPFNIFRRKHHCRTCGK